MADNIEQLYGDYSPVIDVRTVETPRKGLAPLAQKISYASGCDTTHCRRYSPDQVKLAVFSADLTVLCLGTGKIFLTLETLY